MTMTDTSVTISDTIPTWSLNLISKRSFGSRAAQLELEVLKWIHAQGGKVSLEQVFNNFTSTDENSLKREAKWNGITDVRLASAIDDLVVYGVLKELGGDAYGAYFYEITDDAKAWLEKEIKQKSQLEVNRE